MKVGIITYDNPHLKTEQIVLNLNRAPGIDRITVFALPFVPRKARSVRFQHRPDQTAAVASRELARLDKVSWQAWDGASDIGDAEDYFLITGAGIINADRTRGIPIVNCHPGIIPIQRGLDAFKWAILDGNEIGNTLHFIDNEVDSGEVIACLRTEVFADDTLETLARRHYENEIAMMSAFAEYIREGGWTSDAAPQEARMRMPADTEAEMIAAFDGWRDRHCGPGTG